ncbi:MAG: PD-(D/E)XK nuclease family protein [Dysgonomonas sp.]
MNIFKTLANGSGSINEPNVSAFLGYLLNPKEDHALGDVFLKRFLEPLLAKKVNDETLDFMKNRNLSIHSNFEFEVLLEQAFKEDKIQIVDIVILCYEKKSQKGRFLAEDIIRQKKSGVGDPKHIFLIENKIDDNSRTEGQLKEQFKQTKQTIDKLLKVDSQNLISVIYVTPDGEKCKKEFSEFHDTDNKIQLFWHNKNNNDVSKNHDVFISEIIREIIEKESQPIDAYCKYTLQAFLEFIENGFKSTITEELEEKKKREDPRFEYKGEKLSRPKLAEKIIRDYINDYKTKNNKDITFDELSNLFSGKMDKALPPFVRETVAKDKWIWTKNGKKLYDYYPQSTQIADTDICVRNGWSDEKELQELLDKTAKLKLDDIRIK